MRCDYTDPDDTRYCTWRDKVVPSLAAEIEELTNKNKELTAALQAWMDVHRTYCIPITGKASYAWQTALNLTKKTLGIPIKTERIF